MLNEILTENNNKLVDKIVSSPKLAGQNKTSLGLRNEVAKLIIIMKEGGEGASLDIASDITIGRCEDLFVTETYVDDLFAGTKIQIFGLNSLLFRDSTRKYPLMRMAMYDNSMISCLIF